MYYVNESMFITIPSSYFIIHNVTLKVAMDGGLLRATEMLYRDIIRNIVRSISNLRKSLSALNSYSLFHLHPLSK